MATISDVAKASGLSVSTVSRVITVNPDWLFERVSTIEDGRAVVRERAGAQQ